MNQDGTPDRSPGFRDDIQGLRAIAVLTVIVSHAGIGPFHGGYVGVDVFFVISGYLISTLLYREVERRGTLSLAGFYARRARRILPAAGVVTIVTLAASLAWLSLVDAYEVVFDAAWATLFAANFRFASQATDYFAQGEGVSPLQHYWSLAVEEQFYLAWPLILLACIAVARLFHRRTTQEGPGPLPRPTILAVLVILTATSLVYSVVSTRIEPNGAYFSTLARAWELGLGAIVALVAPTLGRRLTQRVRTLLAGGGLLAIATACVTFSEQTLFPGYAALLPVVGAAAVLLAGAGLTSAAPLPVRALSVAPMRAVGDWSYSLYLWHWPVLIIAERHLDRELTAPETLLALTAVLALSVATYRWVEVPFRNGRRFTIPKALALYPVTVALVAGCCTGGYYWVQWRGGELGHNPAITLSNFGVPNEAAFNLDPDPTRALVQASVIAASNQMQVPSNLTPDILDLRHDVPDISDCDYSEGSRDLCPRGDPDGTRTLVVLGDSHGRMWIPALEEFARERGWKAYFLVKPHCSAAYVLTDEDGDDRPWTECPEFHAWTEEQMAELNPDLVVVSTGMFSKHVFVDGRDITNDTAITRLVRAGFVDLFESVRPLTKRLVLLRDVPMDADDPIVCLTTGRPNLGDCAFTPGERSSRIADMSVMAAQETGTPVVDPTPWVCWDHTCPVVVGSTLTYRDRTHLSATYAGELADPLGRALDMAAN